MTFALEEIELVILPRNIRARGNEKESLALSVAKRNRVDTNKKKTEFEKAKGKTFAVLSEKEERVEKAPPTSARVHSSQTHLRIACRRNT